MKFDKLSRFGIFARSQHGQKIPKYWVIMSVSIQLNNHFPEWIIVNIKKFNQFPLWIISTTFPSVLP